MLNKEVRSPTSGGGIRMVDSSRNSLQLAHATLGVYAAVEDAPPLKLLALHQLPFSNFDGAPISIVTDPHQHFDLLYLPHAYEPEHFRAFVELCSNPAAPLIAHDAGFGSRADALLTQGGPGDIAHAATQLAPLCERVNALPDIPRGAERGGLLALQMALTRDKAHEASWAPASPEMLQYELLMGIGEQRELLEKLANLGLMKRRYHERLHCCGSCGSSRVHAREVCTRCCSSDLAEHQLLHHYTCGLQAPEPVFARGDGYECPKCRQPFHHYGVDYDKPGQVISCSACDASISEPDVFFICADCNEQTDSEAAQTREWFHYQLTAQGVSAAEAGVLPLLERASPATQFGNLQEFRVMVQNYVHIAERVERPLSLVRFDLRAEQGVSLERGLNQLFTLVLETARKGDVVAVADGCVLACLPETDAGQVQPLLDRVEHLVGAQLATELTVTPHVIPRDRVLMMLKALS